MEALISEITQRVAKELYAQQAPKGPDPGTDPNAPCSANHDTCNGCGFCVSRKPEIVDTLLQIGASRIAAGPGGIKPDQNVAKFIDHTLLKPDVSRDELKKVCDEAREFGFATVCVNAVNIPFVSRQLAGSGVAPIAVVGFPLGASTGTAKSFEAREAVRAGAKEIDTVINIGALKSKDYATVLEDLAKVAQASRPAPVKVILEIGALNHDEKVIGCALSKASGAAFVKTSTGFGHGGATIEDVELMRQTVGEDMQVKASGGVRSREDLVNMVAAGADRIGASASIAIVSGKVGSASC
ncbi:MAG: deoxyribose-phosphate aldolase [Deltaproteobacteria bacterium]|nr:deoxyribose-phosphate aldolase [Deltaproteobacteria bacterium]